jgi:hypothetical protein
MRGLVVLLSISLGACLATSEVDDDIHDPSDFEEVDTGDGKADGAFSQFNPNRVVSDDAFFDKDALNASQVQGFLDMTPYGKRSFLASESLPSGETVARSIVRIAREADINPLVLLATMQKEAGLISKSVRPSNFRVNFAMGCGCSDGQDCLPQFKGLDKQIACAAERIRSYDDDLLSGNTTISGFKPGKAMTTLEGTRIVPANRSAAILYTYTPWVLRGTGGNWLFWNVWRRFAVHFEYERGMTFPFNEGFIGGSCRSDSDCFYTDAFCMGASSFSDGQCSKPCTSTCPDAAGSGWATTFCIGSSTSPDTGVCVAQCDTDLSSNGCGLGESCQLRERHNQPSVARDVCLF